MYTRVGMAARNSPLPLFQRFQTLRERRRRGLRFHRRQPKLTLPPPFIFPGIAIASSERQGNDSDPVSIASCENIAIRSAAGDRKKDMDVHRGALAEEAMEHAENSELQASANGCFDCNICLDFAAEPVVTLCGHLFCWPCMYRWLQQAGDAATQQCPVCKAALSKDTLVPLYGRGHHAAEKKFHQGLKIPRRPSPAQRLLGADQGQRVEILQREHYDGSLRWDHMIPSSTTVIQTTASRIPGGLALAILPRALRGRESSRIQFGSPYNMVGGGDSPRLRHEMEVERSLYQIWVFLGGCVILCLLLF